MRLDKILAFCLFFQGKCDQWTSQSPDFNLYVALLAHSDDALVEFLNVAIDIFKKCSDVNREPEMRQKYISLP